MRFRTACRFLLPCQMFPYDFVYQVGDRSSLLQRLDIDRFTNVVLQAHKLDIHYSLHWAGAVPRL